MRIQIFFTALLFFFQNLIAQETSVIPLNYNTSGYAENASSALKLSTQSSTSTTLVPTINAEMTVSESGSLNYMLPFEVLKGVNNFQPNFALAYNSQSGNGQAGWGWNIVGISSITQGGKSKEIDGITIGPQFDNDDPFYLDGQRLIKKSSSVFETEKFSKIKITKYTSGDFSFIIKYPDGKIAKYKEISTRQHYISTLIDPIGNEIHYFYDVSANSPRLVRASYGGTDNLTDKFYINFNYITRKSAIKIYRNGVEFINDKILKTVETGSSYTGIYRKYSLGFDFVEGGTIERVRTIDVENESGEKLKPVNFSYNNVNSSGSIDISRGGTDKIPNNVVGLGSVALGEFDKSNDTKAYFSVKIVNDDKSEYYSLPQFPDLKINKTAEFFSGKVLSNNKITSKDCVISITTNYLGGSKDYLGYDIISQSQLSTAKDEIVINILSPESGIKREVKMYLSASNFAFSVKSAGEPHSNLPYDYDVNEENIDIDVTYYSETCFIPVSDRRDKLSRKFLSGDYNNDGLIDLLIIEQSHSNRTGRIYFLEIGKIQQNQTVQPVLLNEGASFYCNAEYYNIEFDGDGLPEIILFSRYGFKPAEISVLKINFQNNTISRIYIAKSLPNSLKYTPGPILFGDYNGDGLTDFLFPAKTYKTDKGDPYSLGKTFQKMDSENQYWLKYTSTGKEFIVTLEDLTTAKLAYLEPHDRNIIKRTSFLQKFWNGIPDSYTATEHATTTILPTDFNGDGKTDFIVVRKASKIKYENKLNRSTFSNVSRLLMLNKLLINNSYNAENLNKIQFIENTSINGTTSFRILPNEIDLENKLISPLSIIIPKNFSNGLSAFSSGVEIIDPLSGEKSIYTVNNDKFLEKQIQLVDNGSGVTQTVEYLPMKPFINNQQKVYTYTPDNSLNYPYYIHDTNELNYLVNKIHTNFDSKILTKEYRYENAIQHLEGKGFLGFQKTYVSDAYESHIRNGAIVNKAPTKGLFWNIQTRDPLMEIAVVVSEYGGIKQPLTKNTITYKKFNKGGNISLILSTDEVSQDYLKKIKISKKYEYDETGDLTLQKAYTDYNGEAVSISEYKYAPEFSNGDHYFYGKINSSSSTTYKNDLSFTTKELTFYNPDGTVQKTEKYSNDPNAPPIVTSYTYFTDGSGNLKTQTLSASGITSQTTEYGYDTTKRYLNSTKTPDDLTSTSVINYLGRVTKETSALGLETSYLYDTWGNITEITDFLGKKTTISKSVVDATAGTYSLSKKREGGTETVVIFDRFDREIISKTQSLNGEWIVVKTEYDVLGRKTKYSEPYKEGETIKWNSIEYDELNRPVKNITYTNKTITTCYEGLKVTVDDGYKKTSKTLDAMGNTIRHQDFGGVIHYKYFPNGALSETYYEGVKTTFDIDDWGNKKKIVDPSAGTFEYEYDSLGRITKEITPKGNTIFTYDTLGRPFTEITTGKSSAEKTYIEKNYEYDSVTKLPTKIKGKSYKADGSTYNDFTYTTLYDTYFRIKGKIEDTPDFTYTTTTTFDNSGKPDVINLTTKLKANNYTSVSEVKNIYDTNGILIEQDDNITLKKIWHVSQVNAKGQTTQLEYGNGYTITNNYNPTDGSLTNTTHQNTNTGLKALEIDYSFDVNQGVLLSRDNKTFGKKETFTFDKLNRLLTEKLNNALVNEYTYDKRGRMTSNTELGKYNYNDTDYKLQSINFNTNGQQVNTNRGFATITYNAFKSPLEITLEGKGQLQYEYNILKTRYRSLSDTGVREKLYTSDFAVEISRSPSRGGMDIKIITFITGDPYSGNYIKREVLRGVALLEKANYFLHRDHLSSILAITKTDGTIAEKRFYDAWGNLKGGSMALLDRGYTGHEHLQSVGLIHMNARIYDPVLRRFLSPDDYIQDPYNTQNYNRYGYVLNNPLLYTDPSGNVITLLGAIAIGAAVGVLTKGIANMIQGIPFWYGIGKAGAMGAVSGAVSFGIGSWAKTLFGELVTVGKALFQAGMHGLSGGLTSALESGSFKGFGAAFASGFASSLISSGVESLGQMDGGYVDAKTGKSIASYNSFGKSDWFKASMIASGGVSGGFSSMIAGGNFMDGFRQGLITSGLNHVASMVTQVDPATRARRAANLIDEQIDKAYNDKDASNDKPILSAQYAVDMIHKVPELNRLLRLIGASGGKLSVTLTNVEYFTTSDGDQAIGTTDYYGNNGVVRLATNAYFNNRSLALTIGHEMIHILNHYSGTLDGWLSVWSPTKANAMNEISAWNWSKAWGSGATQHKIWLPHYQNIFNSK